MVLGIQVVICVLVWGLSAALMGPFGITGVAAAWLIAQTATAEALAVRPRSWVPAARHGASALAVRDRAGLADHGQAGEVAAPARSPRVPVTSAREARLGGRLVRVVSPAPTEIWEEVARADPSITPFQWPAWRDCVCSGGKWRDASRLYQLPGDRQVVLMLARRAGWPARLAPAASWPSGWGTGGVLAPGGVRPEEIAMVCDDLAADRSLSVSVRPGYTAAPSWARVADADFVISRSVHVAEFGGSFDEYYSRSLTVKQRARLRNAQRHLQRSGVVLTSGNSPDLVDAFYQVYLRWIERRAIQRHVPVPLAAWRAQRAEPFEKFATVADRLGPGCHICVASLEDVPIAAIMSLHVADSAVSWRAFTDRAAAPARLRLFELLPLEAVRHACEAGCRRIEMGESVGKPDLAQIKERLGAREMSGPEYCFQRLPLAQGRLALQGYRARAERWLIARTSDPAQWAEAAR
jgi:hypothetical protein